MKQELPQSRSLSGLPFHELHTIYEDKNLSPRIMGTVYLSVIVTRSER